MEASNFAGGLWLGPRNPLRNFTYKLAFFAGIQPVGGKGLLGGLHAGQLPHVVWVLNSENQGNLRIGFVFLPIPLWNASCQPPPCECKKILKQR